MPNYAKYFVHIPQEVSVREHLVLIVATCWANGQGAQVKEQGPSARQWPRPARPSAHLKLCLFFGGSTYVGARVARPRRRRDAV